MDNSNLDDYTRDYFPEGMPQVEFGPFCKKHMNDWDGAGVKLENENIPPECVSNNNSTLLKLNRPYFAPGVVTQRVDDNAYSWLADPGRGVNGPSTEPHWLCLPQYSDPITQLQLHMFPLFFPLLSVYLHLTGLYSSVILFNCLLL